MKYLGLIIAGLIYTVPFYLATQNLLTWALFVIGVAIGLAIMIADEVVLYRIYVDQTPESLQLITRSPLFIAAYPILAIFAITSTSNVLGLGVVLGLGLTLVVEGLQLRSNVPAFKKRFLQHLPAALDRSTVTTLLGLEIAIFAILSVYAWIRI